MLESTPFIDAQTEVLRDMKAIEAQLGLVVQHDVCNFGNPPQLTRFRPFGRSAGKRWVERRTTHRFHVGNNSDRSNPWHTARQISRPSRTSLNGFDGMAGAIRILLNEAMRLERSDYLQAGPHERSREHQGYANGFKRKSVKTRIGNLQFQVPKTRDQAEGVEPFYPKSLERSLRSERALTLAVAEMYVQGVSTRKVTQIVSEMCGLEIRSQERPRCSTRSWNAGEPESSAPTTS